jgi:hypothetical protein
MLSLTSPRHISTLPKPVELQSWIKPSSLPLHGAPSRRHKCAKVYSAVGRVRPASISENDRPTIASVLALGQRAALRHAGRRRAIMQAWSNFIVGP